MHRWYIISQLTFDENHVDAGTCIRQNFYENVMCLIFHQNIMVMWLCGDMST